jgi:cell division protein FtsB
MKKIGFILFVLIITYFIFLIHQDIIDNLELKREQERVIESTQQEEKLAGQFKKRLKDLRRKDYIEELARTRLGLIKKGETAYKVIGR